MYWSTRDVRRRCVYTCRIIEVKPEAETSGLRIKDIRIVHDESNPNFVPYDQLNLDDFDVPNFASLNNFTAASSESNCKHDVICLGSGISASVSSVSIACLPTDSQACYVNGSHTFSTIESSEATMSFNSQSNFPSRRNSQAKKTINLSGLSASTIALLSIKDAASYIPPSGQKPSQGTSVTSTPRDNEELGLLQIANRLNKAASCLPSRDRIPKRARSMEKICPSLGVPCHGKVIIRKRSQSLCSSPIMFQGSSGSLTNSSSPNNYALPTVKFTTDMKKSSFRARPESPLATILPGNSSRSVSFSPPPTTDLTVLKKDVCPSFPEDAGIVYHDEQPSGYKDNFASSVYVTPIIEISEGEDEESMMTENACRSSSSDFLPPLSTEGGTPFMSRPNNDNKSSEQAAHNSQNTALSSECLQSILENVPQDILEGDSVKLVVLTDTEDMSEEDLINLASAALEESTSEEKEGEGGGDNSGKSNSEENSAESSSTAASSNSESGSHLQSQSMSGESISYSHQVDEDHALRRENDGFKNSQEWLAEEEQLCKSKDSTDEIECKAPSDDGNSLVTERVSPTEGQLQSETAHGLLGAGASENSAEEEDDGEEDEKKRKESRPTRKSSNDLILLEEKDREEECNEDSDDVDVSVSKESSAKDSKGTTFMAAQNETADSPESLAAKATDAKGSNYILHTFNQKVLECMDDMNASSILEGNADLAFNANYVPGKSTTHSDNCTDNADLCSRLTSTPVTKESYSLTETYCKSNSEIQQADSASAETRKQGQENETDCEVSDKKDMDSSFQSCEKASDIPRMMMTEKDMATSVGETYVNTNLDIELPREKGPPTSMQNQDEGNGEGILGASVVDIADDPLIDETSVSVIDLGEESEVIELSGPDGESATENDVNINNCLFNNNYSGEVSGICKNEGDVVSEGNYTSVCSGKVDVPEDDDILNKSSSEIEHPSTSTVLNEISLHETPDKHTSTMDGGAQRENEASDSDRGIGSCGSGDISAKVRLSREKCTTGVRSVLETTDEESDYLVLEDLSFDETHDEDGNDGEKKGWKNEEIESNKEMSKSLGTRAPEANMRNSDPVSIEREELAGAKINNEIYNKQELSQDLSPVQDSLADEEQDLKEEIELPKNASLMGEQVENSNHNTKQSISTGSQHQPLPSSHSPTPMPEPVPEKETVETDCFFAETNKDLAPKESAQQDTLIISDRAPQEDEGMYALKETVLCTKPSSGKSENSENQKTQLKMYPLRRRSSRLLDEIKHGSVSDSEAYPTKPVSVAKEKKDHLSDNENKTKNNKWTRKTKPSLPDSKNNVENLGLKTDTCSADSKRESIVDKQTNNQEHLKREQNTEKTEEIKVKETISAVAFEDQKVTRSRKIDSGKQPYPQEREKTQVLKLCDESDEDLETDVTESQINSSQLKTDDKNFQAKDNCSCSYDSQDLQTKLSGEKTHKKSSSENSGPYKCSTCKRMYRTLDSYESHIEICDFEVSTSDEDENAGTRNVNYSSKEFPHQQIDKTVPEFNLVDELPVSSKTAISVDIHEPLSIIITDDFKGVKYSPVGRDLSDDGSSVHSQDSRRSLRKSTLTQRNVAPAHLGKVRLRDSKSTASPDSTCSSLLSLRSSMGKLEEKTSPKETMLEAVGLVSRRSLDTALSPNGSDIDAGSDSIANRTRTMKLQPRISPTTMAVAPKREKKSPAQATSVNAKLSIMAGGLKKEEYAKDKGVRITCPEVLEEIQMDAPKPIRRPKRQKRIWYVEESESSEGEDDAAKEEVMEEDDDERGVAGRTRHSRQRLSQEVKPEDEKKSKSLSSLPKEKNCSGKPSLACGREVDNLGSSALTRKKSVSDKEIKTAAKSIPLNNARSGRMRSHSGPRHQASLDNVQLESLNENEKYDAKNNDEVDAAVGMPTENMKWENEDQRADGKNTDSNDSEDIVGRALRRSRRPSNKTAKLNEYLAVLKREREENLDSERGKKVKESSEPVLEGNSTPEKRGRGRPRIYPLYGERKEKNDKVENKEKKRGRGRPRLYPRKDDFENENHPERSSKDDKVKEENMETNSEEVEAGRTSVTEDREKVKRSDVEMERGASDILSEKTSEEVGEKVETRRSSLRSSWQSHVKKKDEVIVNATDDRDDDKGIEVLEDYEIDDEKSEANARDQVSDRCISILPMINSEACSQGKSPDSPLINKGKVRNAVSDKNNDIKKETLPTDVIDLTNDDDEKHELSTGTPLMSQQDLQQMLPPHVTDAMKASGQKLRIVVRSPNVEAAQKIGELLRKTAMNLTSSSADISVTMANVTEGQANSIDTDGVPNSENKSEKKKEEGESKNQVTGKIHEGPANGDVNNVCKSQHDPETPVISRSETPDSISAAYDIQSDDFSSETSNDCYDALSKSKDNKSIEVNNGFTINPQNAQPSNCVNKQACEDSDDDVIVGEAHGLQPPDPGLSVQSALRTPERSITNPTSFPSMPFIVSLPSSTLSSSMSPQSTLQVSPLSSPPFVVSEISPGRYVIQSSPASKDIPQQPKPEVTPNVLMQTPSRTLLHNSSQPGMLFQTGAQPTVSIPNSQQAQQQPPNLLLQHSSPPSVLLQQPASNPTQPAMPVGSLLQTGSQPPVSFLTLTNPRLITPQLSLQSLNQGSILPSAISIPPIIHHQPINANQSLIQPTVNANQTLLSQSTVNVTQPLMSLLGPPTVYVSNLVQPQTQLQQPPPPSPQQPQLIPTLSGLPLTSPIRSQNPGTPTFNSTNIKLASPSTLSLSTYQAVQSSIQASPLSMGKTTLPPILPSSSCPSSTIHQHSPLPTQPLVSHSSIFSCPPALAMTEPQQPVTSSLHQSVTPARVPPTIPPKTPIATNQVSQMFHETAAASLQKIAVSVSKISSGMYEQRMRFSPPTASSPTCSLVRQLNAPNIQTNPLPNLHSQNQVPQTINYMGSFELNSRNLNSLMNSQDAGHERSKSILDLVKSALTSPRGKSVPGVEVRPVITQTPQGPKHVLRVFIDEDHLKPPTTVTASSSQAQPSAMIEEDSLPYQQQSEQGKSTFTGIVTSESLPASQTNRPMPAEENSFIQSPMSQGADNLFAKHFSRNTVQEGSQMRRPLKLIHSSQATKRKLATTLYNRGCSSSDKGLEVKRPYMEPVERNDGTIRGSYRQVVTRVLKPEAEPNPWHQVQSKAEKHSSLMSLLSSTFTSASRSTPPTPTLSDITYNIPSMVTEPTYLTQSRSMQLSTSSSSSSSSSSSCSVQERHVDDSMQGTSVQVSLSPPQPQSQPLSSSHPIHHQTPVETSPHKRASFPVAMPQPQNEKYIPALLDAGTLMKKPSSNQILKKKLKQKGHADSHSHHQSVREKKKKAQSGPRRLKTASMEGAHPLIHHKKSSVSLPQPSLEEEVVATPLDHDSAGRDHPQESGAKVQRARSESQLKFEITSEDGFSCRGDTMEDAWNQVIEKVKDVRTAARMKQLSYAGISGKNMFGVDHNAVVYLIEQLYGAVHCHHNYKFKFHRYDLELADQEVPLNASGAARSEVFLNRKPYDMFNFLKSAYRIKPGEEEREMEEEMALKSARRATSMSLPMAMRFRKLKTFAKEAVDVYRSKIHGRGLFCKRNIDAGEMVIEYAGEVIRASLTDKREKYYESKGIGCYMFRIDDDEVVDATMHGSAARFINHSCEPNCFSKVIQVDGKKHIVIFAMRPIKRGEELTYDYKFPIEEVKIPCHCGSKRCRKYLN